MNKPLNRLRHHVTGAIERGEAVAIVERTVGNSDPVAEMMAEHRKVLAEHDELVAALADVLGCMTIESKINPSSAKAWAHPIAVARAALAKVSK